MAKGSGGSGIGRGKIVYIEWIDPCSWDEGWQDTDEIKLDLPVVITIGHIIKEDKTRIAISHSMGPKHGEEKGNETTGIFVIPKVLIKKRRVVKI